MTGPGAEDVPVTGTLMPETFAVPVKLTVIENHETVVVLVPPVVLRGAGERSARSGRPRSVTTRNT